MGEKPVETSTPSKDISIVAKSSPGDSGLEDPGIITEETAGGEELAEKDRPPTPELVISGSKPAARVTREPDSDIEADDPIFHNDRDTSATSSRSAPVILERPSSRGGAAFDISFEEENSGTENNTPGLPRRLQRLDAQRSSGKKKRDELTLEELQAKLQAAEQRRKEYEQRVRERMHQEASKAVTYTKQANESLNESVEKTHGDAETKEKAALENRESHLKQLRERLKAKEDRARAVREKKRLLQATGGVPVGETA